MPATYTIREGVTDPVVFELQSLDIDSEDATAVDLTGVTLVDVRFRTKDKSTPINFDDGGAQVAITDAVNGKVTFTPGAADFDSSEQWYEGFIRVTDAGSNIIDFPSDGHFEWVVLEAF